MVSSNNREIYREFEEAFEVYSDAIFRYCYLRINDRERAKELTQEAFTKTWEYLAQGKKVRNFKAFIYRTAHNLLLNEYRDRKVNASLDELKETVDFDPESTEKNPEEVSEMNEILDLLQSLKPEDKEIMIMRYVEDMSIKEISEIINENKNTTSVKIHRIIKKIQEEIK